MKHGKLICGVCVLFSTSCGSSGYNAPAVQPQSVPPSPWQNVKEQTTCEAMNPAFCVGTYGFAVDHSGRYVDGPAPSGNVMTGSITPDELRQLNDDADAVAGN